MTTPRRPTPQFTPRTSSTPHTHRPTMPLKKVKVSGQALMSCFFAVKCPLPTMVDMLIINIRGEQQIVLSIVTWRDVLQMR